ncbi:DinB superfamily protein [Paenibacillus konkukensis]|uniref:DinB superfamily protein n=1 Tax=Paenibacillus konkukensis TaxID=2020716 RepID=A0ABY4RMD1_9BACL|nr:DinB family protein [Paenibacillus konkukensis]UQZ82604.1 DinB superfamily protein [Paenibacillus konkukensis]
MRESYLFGLINRGRGKLLELLEACPEAQREEVPQGFNNHLLWQAGHLVTVTDGIVLGFSGEPSAVPATYRGLFGNGTKPADWTGEPPAWDTLIAQLREQSGQLEAALSGKMDAPVKENFFKAETVGELLQAVMLHDNQHLGMINAMLKVLKQG